MRLFDINGSKKHKLVVDTNKNNLNSITFLFNCLKANQQFFNTYTTTTDKIIVTITSTKNNSTNTTTGTASLPNSNIRDAATFRTNIYTTCFYRYRPNKKTTPHHDMHKKAITSSYCFSKNEIQRNKINKYNLLIAKRIKIIIAAKKLADYNSNNHWWFVGFNITKSEYRIDNIIFKENCYNTNFKGVHIFLITSNELSSFENFNHHIYSPTLLKQIYIIETIIIQEFSYGMEFFLQISLVLLSLSSKSIVKYCLQILVRQFNQTYKKFIINIRNRKNASDLNWNLEFNENLNDFVSVSKTIHVVRIESLIKCFFSNLLIFYNDNQLQHCCLHHNHYSYQQHRINQIIVIRTKQIQCHKYHSWTSKRVKITYKTNQICQCPFYYHRHRHRDGQCDCDCDFDCNFDCHCYSDCYCHCHCHCHSQRQHYRNHQRHHHHHHHHNHHHNYHHNLHHNIYKTNNIFSRISFCAKFSKCKIIKFTLSKSFFINKNIKNIMNNVTRYSKKNNNNKNNNNNNRNNDNDYGYKNIKLKTIYNNICDTFCTKMPTLCHINVVVVIYSCGCGDDGDKGDCCSYINDFNNSCQIHFNISEIIFWVAVVMIPTCPAIDTTIKHTIEIEPNPNKHYNHHHRLYKSNHHFHHQRCFCQIKTYCCCGLNSLILYYIHRKKKYFRHYERRNCVSFLNTNRNAASQQKLYHIENGPILIYTSANNADNVDNVDNDDDDNDCNDVCSKRNIIKIISSCYNTNAYNKSQNFIHLKLKTVFFVTFCEYRLNGWWWLWWWWKRWIHQLKSLVIDKLQLSIIQQKLYYFLWNCHHHHYHHYHCHHHHYIKHNVLPQLLTLLANNFLNKISARIIFKLNRQHNKISNKILSTTKMITNATTTTNITNTSTAAASVYTVLYKIPLPATIICCCCCGGKNKSIKNEEFHHFITWKSKFRYGNRIISLGIYNSNIAKFNSTSTNNLSIVSKRTISRNYTINTNICTSISSSSRRISSSSISSCSCRRKRTRRRKKRKSFNENSLLIDQLSPTILPTTLTTITSTKFVNTNNPIQIETLSQSTATSSYPSSKSYPYLLKDTTSLSSKTDGNSFNIIRDLYSNKRNLFDSSTVEDTTTPVNTTKICGNINTTIKKRKLFSTTINKLLWQPNNWLGKATLQYLFSILFIMSTILSTSGHSLKYSTHTVKTKYGLLRGIIVRSNPTVEAFLGVPYASPPMGNLRYMPPVTPSMWRNTRLADRFSPVCPQSRPVPTPTDEALFEIPRGRLAQLKRMWPLLANQSEDCLYLNLYVPRTDEARESGTGNDPLMATIVYVHGESYEWNSGNPYDGSVLAAHGNIIVVTINFRLGVLGFLKTGTKGSNQGNFGLMDLVAGLHWLRENLPAFNGDSNKVTLMGHGTGASLANILIVSPVASHLINRAILLSGSALSPWAIQKDPLYVKRKVAEVTGCHGDLLEDDLAPCLRLRPVTELLSVQIDSPRFLPGFAPFVDGTVIANPGSSNTSPLTLPAGSAIASTSGIEFADFPSKELLFGLTTTESYLDLSAQDLEFGFNETRRDRILRTYVRNIYHYHLNEIYSALKNEYTDWERPPRNPMGSRDASLELLSDGHTAAPLVRLGYLHSLRGGRSFFLHFRHQSGERDFPQRGGSVRGEDVPFCLGLPITPLFPHNYTKQDIKISRTLVQYIAYFAQTGNPNEPPSSSVDISHNTFIHNHIATPSGGDHHGLVSVSTLAMATEIGGISSSSISHYDGGGDGSTTSIVSDNIIHSKKKRQVIFLHQNEHQQLHQQQQIMLEQHEQLLQLQQKKHNHRSKRLRSRIEHQQKQPSQSYNDNDMVSDDNNDDDDKSDSEEDEDIGEDNLDEIDEDIGDKSIEDLDSESSTIITNRDRLDDSNDYRAPFWDTYDSVNQLYLDMGNKIEIRNHYRGHKLSMWLSLIPQLHSPGDLTELSMRHHHFTEESAQFYDGIVRQQTLKRPIHSKVSIAASGAASASIPTTTVSTRNINSLTSTATTPSSIKADISSLTASSVSGDSSGAGSVAAVAAQQPMITTECPPNTTIVPTLAATRPHHQQPSNSLAKQNQNLLNRLANSQYQSYTTALTVTIAVGCFLLLLNILIFAGIYYQREKRANDAKKKEELTEAENRCSPLNHHDKYGSGTASGGNVSGIGNPSGSGIGSASGGGGGISGKCSSRKSSLQSTSGFTLSGNFGEYSCYDEKIIQCKEKHGLADICNVELPMKEYNKCGSNGGGGGSGGTESNTNSLRRTATHNVQTEAASNGYHQRNLSNLMLYPPMYSGGGSGSSSNGCVGGGSGSSSGSSNGLVTYHQFHKNHPALHHHQQYLQSQHQPQSNTLQQQPPQLQMTSSPMTEQCNQSTQSGIPDVQDVGTGAMDNDVDVIMNLQHRDGGGGGACTEINEDDDDDDEDDDDNGGEVSPGIPEPPPPPRSMVPVGGSSGAIGSGYQHQSGILRQQVGPTTPSATKKRVQIQEISV